MAIKSNWGRRGILIAAAIIVGASASGLRHPDMSAGEAGQVASVQDGDTFYLESGLKVRLASIEAPTLSLGRHDVTSWPLAIDAKTALARLTQDHIVQLFYNGDTRDRYDRAIAHVYRRTPDGHLDLWLQEVMLRQGWARVSTWPHKSQQRGSDITVLYAAEREARQEQRGIWADDFYAIRSPDPNNLAQDVDSFQVVEGIVTSVADVRGRIYLNFGADYKTDFTVAIAKRDRKRFTSDKAGAFAIDPMTLEGARIRVRGWIELTNGPMIWLDHPERLEVLD